MILTSFDELALPVLVAASVERLELRSRARRVRFALTVRRRRRCRRLPLAVGALA
jgi:hypothetical protein